MYRQKASVQDIRGHLSTLPDAFSGPDEPLSDEIRMMAVETLLQLGSRSFSHFLNATERFLDVLRYLTPDPASRQVLLRAVHRFWKSSPHMRLVVLDKYVQYGILEGLDIIDWVFAATPDEEMGLGGGNDADGWTDGWRWEILRMCLDKHVGRVVGVRNRVKLVDKEDETARARRAAERLERGEGVGEDALDGADDADGELSQRIIQQYAGLHI
jgi:nuclear cap-binding protein subunit 1